MSTTALLLSFLLLVSFSIVDARTESNLRLSKRRVRVHDDDNEVEGDNDCKNVFPQGTPIDESCKSLASNRCHCQKFIVAAAQKSFFFVKNTDNPKAASRKFGTRYTEAKADATMCPLSIWGGTTAGTPCHKQCLRMLEFSQQYLSNFESGTWFQLFTNQYVEKTKSMWDGSIQNKWVKKINACTLFIWDQINKEMKKIKEEIKKKEDTIKIELNSLVNVPMKVNTKTEFADPKNAAADLKNAATKLKQYDDEVTELKSNIWAEFDDTEKQYTIYFLGYSVAKDDKSAGQYGNGRISSVIKELSKTVDVTKLKNYKIERACYKNSEPAMKVSFDAPALNKVPCKD